jgi:hypothetical protein
MGVIWTMMVPSMIFTRIKNEFSAKTKEKYKMTDKNFSTVGSSDTPAVFPFVYVQMLAPLETGRDLEGTSINAGIYTFQIDVTDNKSQSNARTVMMEVLKVMKKMAFQVTQMPIYEDTKDVHRCTARFRRTISENDIL